MTVFVGTAGFSYSDWKGNFYPAGVAQADMLKMYARSFPVVEINSTYYAIPSPDRVNSMAKRTPPHFLFNVKANREMTHEISGGAGPFDAFRKALRPLADHGKLGCVLAQFPWGFKDTVKNREYLKVLAGRLEGLPTIVEFRNDCWDTDEALGLLRDAGLGYCCVDEPALKGLPTPRVEATSAYGYVRFHGRNAETWWAKDRESWERYDYLYTKAELSDWVPKVAELEEQTDRVYVIFNNHYKGQAPTNARMFEEMLKGVLGDSVVTVEPPEEDEPLF